MSRGRYGCIWKARLYEQQIVAVKIFPASDADSWVQEQEIYATPRLKDHPNVLSYFAAEARGTGTGMEYWLITAFHERGSMYDFLKVRHLEERLTIERERGFFRLAQHDYGP